MAERDANGRFAPGVSGNPKGRKPREIERTYLDIVRKVVTDKVFEEGVEVAVAQFLKGDPVARKWLSDILLGTLQRIEASGVNGLPLQTKIIIQYANDNFAETPLVADAGEEGAETI